MICERCLALLDYGKSKMIISGNKNVCICSECYEDIRQQNIEEYEKEKAKKRREKKRSVKNEM